jgi:cytochrome b pre-mRNA-processing protein 3
MPASVNQLAAGCNTAVDVAATFTMANQGNLMMFGLFRKNNVNKAAVDRQYGLLTAAARQPQFFRSANVPDTVMGRFEMLSTVLILYFRRTRQASPAAKRIAQEIVDAFFEDLDHSLRELGIGDQGVPKRMKKLASMFYGRVDSYGKALDDADHAALEAALKRNFHPEDSDANLSMASLADYMLEADRVLRALPDDVLEHGGATLPVMPEGEER